MIKCSAQEMIARIKRQELFHAVAEDYSFEIRIDHYAHYVCAAVHDGHHFPKSLWENCLHSEHDRWYEEDPFTAEMVDGHPILIKGLDSRFYYDLNRAPESAIYDTAWGKPLWKSPLSPQQKQKALDRHASFYDVVLALIGQLEKNHPQVLVYDMHSYNWQRWERSVPVFNLGTSNVDEKRYHECIKEWQKRLSTMDLPIDQPIDCTINDVFQGNGYFLKAITSASKNTLVLATEISKIYCEELTGQSYPEVIHAVHKQLAEMIPSHANQFKSKDSV